MLSGGEGAAEIEHVAGLIPPTIQNQFAVNVEPEPIGGQGAEGVCAGLEAEITLPAGGEVERRDGGGRRAGAPVEVHHPIGTDQRRTAAQSDVVVVTSGECIGGGSGAGGVSRSAGRGWCGRRSGWRIVNGRGWSGYRTSRAETREIRGGIEGAHRVAVSGGGAGCEVGKSKCGAGRIRN